MQVHNFFKCCVVFFALTTLISQHLQAQSDLNFFVESGIPQGTFSQNTKAFGLGFGGSILFPIDQNRRIMVGGELNYEIYGKEIKDDPTGSYELITNNNIFMTHAIIRLMPFQEGALKPYIDLKGGLKNFYTKTKVKDDDIGSDPVEVIGEFNDVAGSYGGAFGLSLQRSEDVSLFAEVSFLAGGEATYVDRRSVTRDVDNNVIFDSKTSRTNMTLFRIGVTLYPGGE
ncbi:MAG: hypothetical protein AAFO69_03910 [Bacteroidota bacterium]